MAPVTGTVTLHHQWGFGPAEMTTIPANGILSFELQDGSDILVWRTTVGRDGKAVTFHTGYVVTADGRVTQLRRGDFTMTPTRFCRRDVTCRYPVSWDINVKGLRLHADAALDAAELRPTRHPEVLALWRTYSVPYWDGETSISGDATGRGWANETNYCLA